MSPRHPVVVLAACAGWLTLTTGYAAAAAEPTVDLGGERVAGSTDPARPTPLETGLWADSLGDAESPGDLHHYRYQRTMRDSTVHVGVVAASSDPEADGLGVRIVGPGQTECDSATASPRSYARNAVFGARVWAGPLEAGSSGDEPCLQAATLDIVVERTSAGSGDEDLPIAIKVVEEAPVSGAAAGALPDAEESPSFAPGERPEGGEDLEGATSFDGAPGVPVSGGTASFSTAVGEGEERLFRVPLSWGQELSVEARVPRLDQAVLEARSYLSPTVELSLVDPLRSVVDDGVTGLTPYVGYGDEAGSVAVALPPLRYLNRYADQAATLPGDHWLSIGVSPTPEDEEPLAVPLDVTVTVSGQAAEAPAYQGTAQSPDTFEVVAGYRPEEPFLIGPGQFSAVASGAPVLPDDASGGWWGPRRYAGIGLAVVSLLVCGVGARRLVR